MICVKHGQDKVLYHLCCKLRRHMFDWNLIIIVAFQGWTSEACSACDSWWERAATHLRWGIISLTRSFWSRPDDGISLRILILCVIDQHLLLGVEFYISARNIVANEIINKHAACVAGCRVYCVEIFRVQFACHRSVWIISCCCWLSLLILLYKALVLLQLLVATSSAHFANLLSGFRSPRATLEHTCRVLFSVVAIRCWWLHCLRHWMYWSELLGRHSFWVTEDGFQHGILLGTTCWLHWL